MDDFDIEMGDAVDVHMEEEPQAAEILVGDDLQVCFHCLQKRTFPCPVF